MKKTSMSMMVWFGALLITGSVAVITGCRSSDKTAAPSNPSTSATSDPALKGETKAEAKHKAHHGGCLNAIETCAVGHAEVKLEDDVMKVWFVGGENETDKAVRAKDKQIVLAVTLDGGKAQSLTLEAKPNELADEKVGECSQFEGKADWVVGVKKFTASGKVNLKGKERPIKIEYPEGYDPD